MLYSFDPSRPDKHTNTSVGLQHGNLTKEWLKKKSLSASFTAKMQCPVELDFDKA